MNVMSFESRRERTHPRKVISLPTGKSNACLTEMNRDAISAKYRINYRGVNYGTAYNRIEQGAEKTFCL